MLFPLRTALHLLVGAARAPYRRDLLPAGGGGDRAGLRRVPWTHGADRPAQCYQQRGAGMAASPSPSVRSG